MKNKFTSALVAMAAILPVALVGQSTTSSPSSTSSSQQRPQSTQQPSQGSHDAAGRMSSPGSATSSSATSGQLSSSQWSSDRSSQFGSANIQRLSEKQLEQRVMADDLKGKKVVDSSGQEIGKVKGVGIAAFRDSQNQRPETYGARAGISGNVAGVGASASVGAGTTGSGGVSAGANVGGSTDTSRDRTAGVSGSASTMSSDATSSSSMPNRSSSLSQSLSSSSSDQVNIFVSMDELKNGDVLAIPASELTFDESNDQLRINRARQELVKIAQGGTTGSTGTITE